MAKKISAEEQTVSEDGHYLLKGVRWHYPKMFDPTACAVTGCTRVLGQVEDPDDDLDDDSEEETEVADVAAA